jgi:hypothetical protein
VITGEQDAGKLARPVREGADGKGPGDRDLAGGLLHFEGGRGKVTPLAQPPMGCISAAFCQLGRKAHPFTSLLIARHAGVNQRGRDASRLVRYPLHAGLLIVDQVRQPPSRDSGVGALSCYERYFCFWRW